MKRKFDRQSIQLSISKFFCSGFYTGESPIAPGTVGSFAYLIIWYFVLSPNYLWQFLAFLAVTILGWMLTAYLLPRLIPSAKEKKQQDPSWIVIDEWAGLAFAFLAINPLDVWEIIIAFTLFRIFDASKVWPVSLAEKWPGAKGVICDDLVAGGLVALLMTVFKLF